MAGKQLGRDDERDLFPVILNLAGTIRPRVLMIENVRGLLQAKFDAYRGEVTSPLERMGYRWDWRLLQARGLRGRPAAAPVGSDRRTAGDLRVLRLAAAASWRHAHSGRGPAGVDERARLGGRSRLGRGR